MPVYAEMTEPATEETEIVTEEMEITETVSDTQETEEPEYIAPEVKISIVPPEGWYKSEVVVSVSVEDTLMTGNLAIESVKVKISQNGSWTDITDDMNFVVSENCSVYVMVTDKNGSTYEKNRYITCFDKSKPVLNAAVNGGLLSVQAQDNDSGIKAVYVNGYEFNELTNGVLNIRLQEFDTGYEYFTIQAMDMAGNMSDVYRVKNIYYRTEEDDQENVLPEDATPTEPSDAKAEVTEHADESKKEFYTIKTDSEKVFYLIIDKSGENEQVYFLTEISERDLLNVTADTMQTLPQNSAITEMAIPNDTEEQTDMEDLFGQQEDTETDISTETEVIIEPDVTEEKEGNSMIVYIIMGIAAVIGIGAGYYFKVYKKKQEIAEEDEELFEEESYENENEDWNNYEVEDTADDTEDDINEG